MSELVTYCPKCRFPYEVDEADVGTLFSCPQCQNQYTIPAKRKITVADLRGILIIIGVIAMIPISIWIIDVFKPGWDGSFGVTSNNAVIKVEDPKTLIKIQAFSWQRTGLDVVMLANFSIKNELPVDIKDFTITCTHSGKSGTIIDSNSKTIFDIIKSGETKQFLNVNMGFIDNQASSSRAEITDFAVVK